MMDFENEANPFEERRRSIGSWRAIAITDISESAEIISQAIMLNSIGFDEKDALHLACAIIMKCGIFLSTDDGVLKKCGLVSDIAILNPIEYATSNFNDNLA